MVYKNTFFTLGLLVIVTLLTLTILLKELELCYYYTISMKCKKGFAVLKDIKVDIDTFSNKNIPDIKISEIVKPSKTSEYMTVAIFAKQFSKEVNSYRSGLPTLNIILSIKFRHVYVTVLVNLVYVYLTISTKKKKQTFGCPVFGNRI